MNRTIILWAVLVSTCGLAGWQEIQLPTDSHLNGVSVLAPDDVWVAGQNGVILHFDGETWQSVASSTTKNLEAISMISSTEGWAVGSEGTIVHCVSGVWSSVLTGDDQISYEDVIAFDSSNVVVIGYGFLAGGSVSKWNGTEFIEVYEIGGNPQRLAASDPNNIWIVGSQNLRVHFDGISWEHDNSNLPEACNLWGVTIDENGYPIICGNRLPEWDKCYILTNTGNGWSELYFEYEPWILTVDISETVGFAAGKDGRLIQRSIFGWQRSTSTSTIQINRLAMFDMSLGYAACNSGRVLVFNETAVDVVLNQRRYAEGDTFSSECVISNPGDPRTLDLFILLDVYGSFYFWPTFDSSVSFNTLNLQANDSMVQDILPDFVWPAGVGSADGIMIWGALIEQGVLVAYDTEVFGWE